MLEAIPLSRFLLRGLVIWFHEFGHALVAWLSGRRAIPLPLGWTNFQMDKSVVVMISLLGIEIMLFYMGVRARKWGFTVFAVLLLFLQLYGWFCLPMPEFLVLMSWPGIAGEFIIATALIILSLFPLPEYFKWSIYRWPTQVAASCIFIHSNLRWQRIASGDDAVPYGSIWIQFMGTLTN
ncbi:MAG: M50 family metallopeptidase [Synechococcus sp.]